MQNNLNASSKVKNLFYLYENQKFKKLERECYKVINSSFSSSLIYNLLGVSLTKQLKLKKAINIFRSALKLDASNTDTLVNLGLAQKEAKLFNEAINSNSKAIEINPNCFQAYINLSDLYNIKQNFFEALKNARHATILNPESAEAFCNIGTAFNGLRNYDLAAQNYEKAFDINPNSPLISHNFAIALMKLKKFMDAKVILENNIAKNNINNRSQIDFALCLFELGEIDNSVIEHKKAVATFSRSFEVHNNYGNLLLFLGKDNEAITHFNIAKKISSNNPIIHYNLGRAEVSNKNYKKALEYCDYALKANPSFHKALNLAALIHRVTENDKQATKCFQKALEIQPDDHEVLFNYGQHCISQNLYQKGIDLLSKAKSNNCPYPEVNFFIAMANHNLLGIDEALDDYLKIIADKNTSKELLFNSFLLLNYSDKLSPQKIFNLHKKYDFDQKLVSFNKNSNKKIRVGYVSSDFRTHSVNYFFSNILKNHNKMDFEIFCYYNNNYDDKETFKLKENSTFWRNIFLKSDEYVVNIIKQDKIDILVDLNGHTAGNRLGVFKKRAAFKQITWLGYPNTTGLKNMDYRFTDNFADPINTNDKFYTEILYRLPNSFLCYSNGIDAKISNEIPYVNNGFLTFGSFNNLNKINSTTIELWSKILLLMPNSKLMLKSPANQSDDLKNRLIEKFASYGADANQLIFEGRTEEKEKHLEMYNLVDVALDTFPYNGATTTFEALLMGVPVITLCGDKHVSRVSNSILRNLSLDEFVANTKKEYINIAYSQLKNIKKLEYLKKNLRLKLLNSSLCDEIQFTKNIENAYKEILKD